MSKRTLINLQNLTKEELINLLFEKCPSSSELFVNEMDKKPVIKKKES